MEIKSLDQIAELHPELAATIEENKDLKGIHLVGRSEPDLEKRYELVKAFVKKKRAEREN